MTRRARAAGKAPVDLRFANAQDPKGRLELELGVFEVPGMSAADLRGAIVASSRPNAPGLIAEASTLGGRPVTAVVYPGGTVLYLYEQGNRVLLHRHAEQGARRPGARPAPVTSMASARNA